MNVCGGIHDLSKKYRNSKKNYLTIKKPTFFNVVYVGAYKSKRHGFLAPGDFGPVS